MSFDDKWLCEYLSNRNFYDLPEYSQKIYRSKAREIQRRILKDFIEWGDEPCFDHDAELSRAIEKEFGIGSVTLRKVCPECQQSLKQLMEKPEVRFGGWHLCGQCLRPVTNGETCKNCEQLMEE